MRFLRPSYENCESYDAYGLDIPFRFIVLQMAQDLPIESRGGENGLIHSRFVN
jgi:hypothetical protein